MRCLRYALLALELATVSTSLIASGARLVVVTGGSSGIGKECCRRLASLEGYRVMIGCRNVTAGQEAVADIVRENPDACVECHSLDLASFSSVRSFARKAIGSQPVSAMVHNAGVMAPPYQTTLDGHELTFQVNHLSPFLLTDLLLPNLRKAYEDTGDLSRVVLVSSSTHKWASARGKGAAGGLASGAGAVFNGETVTQRGWAIGKWKTYASSKLCNVLYTSELTRRYGGEESGVIGVAVRPGTVATGISRHSPLLRLLFAVAHPFLTSVQNAGEYVARAVVHPDVAAGGYYDRNKLTVPSARAQDVTLQVALWEVTQDVLISGGDLQRAVSP